MQNDTRKEYIYSHAEKLSNGESIEDLKRAIIGFKQIADWKDAGEKLNDVQQKLVALEENQALIHDTYLRAVERRHNAPKKRRARRTALAAALIVFSGAMYGINNYYLPSVKYNQAESATRSGNLDGAIELYSELGGYEDSEEKLNDLKYTKAEEYAAGQDFDRAISLYNELAEDEWKDSDEKIAAVRFQKAQAAFNESDYMTVKGELDDMYSNNQEYENLWTESVYQYALQLKNEGRFEEAIPLMRDISEYHDAKAQLDVIYYEYATALFNEENYKKAYEQLKSISDEAREGIAADPLYLDTVYRYGRSLIESGNSMEGIAVLDPVKDYQDTASIINDTKYQYVLNHKNGEDVTTYQYLKDLSSIAYADSSAMYSELYSPKCEIVINSSESSSSPLNTNSIGNRSPLYVHYKLTGGTPVSDEKTSLHFVITYPDGKSETADLSQCNKGTQGTINWGSGLYQSTGTAPAGTFTVTVYGNDAYLNSASVAITKD